MLKEIGRLIESTVCDYTISEPDRRFKVFVNEKVWNLLQDEMKSELKKYITIPFPDGLFDEKMKIAESNSYVSSYFISGLGWVIIEKSEENIVKIECLI